MLSNQSEHLVRFVHSQAEENLTEILFASYLKKDFVARALILMIEPRATIQTMRFQSNDYGIATWSNGRGFHQKNVWEDEDAGIDPESLKRFRFPLLNGATSVEFTLNTIVPDVIDHLENQQLASWVKKVVRSQAWLEPVNPQLLRP